MGKFTQDAAEGGTIMGKRKKYTLLSLTAVMAACVCLVGCGDNGVTEGRTEDGEQVSSESTDSDGGAFKKGGKITVFQSKTEIMEDLAALAREYTKETGVEVELQETTGDSYFSDLKTGLANGDGPTIFSLQPGAESREMSDYLEDLKDLSFADKILEGMADTIAGKTVGIPYTVEGFGLVYNANLVEVSGLTSTDALADYLEDSSSKGVNGLGLSQEDYFLIAHILNTPFAVQKDPDTYLQKVFGGQERLVKNKAFKEFGRLMEEIRENCTNPAEITYESSCEEFAAGRTAMIHQGNWCYSMLAGYNADFDMGITAVPIRGNSRLSVSVPAAWYVNMDAPDDEKALAKDFLEWMYTSKTGETYLMDKFKFIPVIEGMTSENLDPVSQSVADAAASGNTIPWVMSDWPAGIVTTDLAPLAKEFFTTDMSGKKFLNKLNDAFVSAAQY